MEPEQPIEKLLKAAASKRREQAGGPFRLHPADRRLLQGEVSRTFGAQPTESDRSTFARSLRRRLWPGFGWTFGVITGVVTAALLMWPTPPGSNTQLAYWKDSAANSRAFKSEIPKAESERQIAANRAAPASPATEMQNRPDAASTLNDEVAPPASVSATTGSIASGPAAQTFADASREQDEAKTRSAQMPALAGSPRGQAGLADSVDRNYRLKKDLAAPSETLSSEKQVAAKSTGEGSQVTSNLAQAPSPKRSLGLESDRLSLDKELSKSGSVLAPEKEKASETSSFYFYSNSGAGLPVGERQRFAQRKALAGSLGGKSAESGVLRTFEIQYTGNEVKIVDEDGSIYSGGLLPRPEFQKQSVAARRSPAPTAATSEVIEQKTLPADAKAQTTPVAYSFKASGTNRTLNEKVILNGNIFFPGATNTWSLNGFGGAAGGSNSPSLLLPLKNSKISGDAQVGEGAFKFDAEPIK